MPNIPPRKSARQTPAGERLLQMLTARMADAMPSADLAGMPTSSFEEAAMRSSPYNLSDYTPEEIEQYRRLRYSPRNTLGGYPINAAAPSDRDIASPQKYAMKDSLYTAQRLSNAETLARLQKINDLFGLGSR